MLSVRLRADPQFITLTRGHTPAPPAPRVFIISHKNIFRELRHDGRAQLTRRWCYIDLPRQCPDPGLSLTNEHYYIIRLTITTSPVISDSKAAV